MKKRFTDIEKWGDLWFRKLPVPYKCFWSYLCDSADSSGVWKVDSEAASFYIGAKVDALEALRLFNDGKARVSLLGSDRWLVLGFIAFQYGALSRECKAHIGVFSAIERNGLTLTKDCKEVIIPEGAAPIVEQAPAAAANEPAKAPARPVAVRKHAASAILPEWIDPAMWTAFKEMRARLRRPMTATSEALTIKKLTAMRAEGQNPNAILEQSVANSWQGVFPLRDQQRAGSGAAGVKPGKYGEVRRISTGSEEKVAQ